MQIYENNAEYRIFASQISHRSMQINLPKSYCGRHRQPLPDGHERPSSLADVAASRLLMAVAAVALMLFVVACSSVKHVPDGSLLLDDVEITITDDKKAVSTTDLYNYLRQIPNHEVLGGMKMQLAFYNMSGRDSTKWFNRWVQRVGTAPVLYDHTLTEASINQIRTALVNMGYMHATVSADTFRRDEKKKISVRYNVTLNAQHYVESIDYNIADDTLRTLIMADSAQFLVKPGTAFDRNTLDQQRAEITERLKNKGYYAFSKDYITFTADTAENSLAVRLTMNLMPPYHNDKFEYYTNHRPFYFRNVTFVTNYDPMTPHEDQNYTARDTTSYGDLIILYDSHYLRRRVLDECCFIRPGDVYTTQAVDKTYQAFGRMNIVKFINIEIVPVGEIDGKVWLDAYVLLTESKSQTVSLELEGTNSEGDLGFGIGAGYQHRNLLRGAEVLNTKLRMSYESISGDLSGLINDNYSEYTAEAGITYPKFKAPFLSKEFKRNILATTELATSISYQERPEYTRLIAGAGWKYHWTETQRRTRHTYNLLDINYVYLPESQIDFLDEITNPLLRYSYEDHFIVSAGYSFYHTNKKQNTIYGARFQSNVYTIRAAAESAGSLLYGISNLLGQHKDDDDSYKIFGIRYSQYFKVDADYSITHYFTPRSSLAFHVGAGVAVPYGNSSALPFEKRFYAGGANSVRGWGVRSLGPGSYDGSNSVNNFIYQCGDVRLDINLEYRAKIFWIFELGAFIDAGNIWTIKDYEDQPGGVFRIDSFYEQIAAAYGLGLRLDFTYFLLRVDWGMKAFNPASGQKRWPIASPSLSRDGAVHFSVGYPF